MVEVDYYSILGVSRDASATEIRQAYKKMALAYHPDRVPEADRGAAEAKFKEIYVAYEILSNENNRAAYDSQQYASASGFNAKSFYEFFESVGGNTGAFDAGFTQDFFGKQKSFDKYRSGQGRTPDAHVDLDVTLNEVYVGKSFKLSISRKALCRKCSGTGARPKTEPRICKSCHGSGVIRKITMVKQGYLTSDVVPCDICHGRGFIIRSKDLCRSCKGSGTYDERRQLEANLPRGCGDGERILFEQMADEAYGKATGDIIVTVRIQPHPDWTLKGSDLHGVTQISLSESLTGFSRVVATHLDGRGLNVTVSPGTIIRPGQYMKISNEGMPRKSLDLRGDMYLLICVDFPTTLSEATIAQLRLLLPMPQQLKEPPVKDDVKHSLIESPPKQKGRAHTGPESHEKRCLIM